MKHPFTKSAAKTAKPAKIIKPAKIKKPKKSISFAQSVFLLLFASIGLFGVSGWYWYQNVLTDPQRIISDMLDKSLQTSSVYKTVTQKGDGNDVNQSVYVSFTPQTLAQSITNLKEDANGAKTSVTTETIGTKNADYVQYSALSISGRNADQNFDSVLNTWGKRESSAESQQPVSFLNDALFAVVPFGNLDTGQRNVLKDEINKVNLYKTEKTKTDFNYGRPFVNYDVNIAPKALVQVLAKYVELTGVGDASELKPELYEDAPDIQVKLQVDMLSRHVRTIEFAGTGRLETYAGYNAKNKVELPTKTISIDELQSRVSKIEEQIK